MGLMTEEEGVAMASSPATATGLLAAEEAKYEGTGVTGIDISGIAVYDFFFGTSVSLEIQQRTFRAVVRGRTVEYSRVL